MKRRVLAAGILAATVGSMSSAALVAADSAVSTYHFYDCTGPGVPSEFTAVKTALPGAAAHSVSAASAFRVTGSTNVYVVYDFGFGAPNGITVSGVATDWCYADFAGAPHTLVGGEFQGS